MAKITIKKADTDVLYHWVDKLAPAYKEVFTDEYLAKAIKGSKERANIFGVIINAENIRKDGRLQSIIDIFTKKSAEDVAGLIIYRLTSAHNAPQIVEV